MFNFANHTTKTHHHALQQFISMNKGCKTALLLGTPDSIAWYLSKLRALRNTLTNLLRVGINKTISTTSSRCQGFVPCEELTLLVSFQELARMEAVISQVNFHVPFCHFMVNLTIDSVTFKRYSQKSMCFSSSSTPWPYWQQNYLEAENCVKGHCWAIVQNAIFIGSPFGSELHSAAQKSHINIAFVRHGCPVLGLKWRAIVRVHSVCCQQK